MKNRSNIRYSPMYLGDEMLEFSKIISKNCLFFSKYDARTSQGGKTPYALISLRLIEINGRHPKKVKNETI